MPAAAKPAKERFDAALAKLRIQYDGAFAAALNALDELGKQAKAAGKLETAMDLERERGRAATLDPTIGTLLADVVAARKKCDEAIRKARTDYDKNARTLHGQYIKELDELAAAETKANRIDSARQVRAYQRRLDELGPPLLVKAPPLPPTTIPPRKEDYVLVSGHLTDKGMQNGVLYVEVSKHIYGSSTKEGAKILLWRVSEERADLVAPSDIRRKTDAWLCLNRAGKWTKLLLDLPAADKIETPQLHLPVITARSPNGEVGTVYEVVYQIVDKRNALIGHPFGLLWVTGVNTDELRNDQPAEALAGQVFKVSGNKQYVGAFGIIQSVPLLTLASAAETEWAKKQAGARLDEDLRAAKLVLQKNETLRQKAEHIFFPEKKK